jgi:hypothetical protein
MWTFPEGNGGNITAVFRAEGAALYQPGVELAERQK